MLAMAVLEAAAVVPVTQNNEAKDVLTYLLPRMDGQILHPLESAEEVIESSAAAGAAACLVFDAKFPIVGWAYY